MAEQIDFENGQISNFEGLVTLTLDLWADWLYTGDQLRAQRSVTSIGSLFTAV